jgi:hypothetical protein
MIEALIALPVLFILLVGVSFMRELHGERQAALAEARRCALMHAASGCGAEAPAGCEDVIGAGPDLGAVTATTSLLDETRAAYADSPFPLLENVPVLDVALTKLFGTATSARAERSLASLSRDDKPLVVTGGMTLLCNEGRAEVMDLATNAVCNTIDVFDLCGDK